MRALTALIASRRRLAATIALATAANVGSISLAGEPVSGKKRRKKRRNVRKRNRRRARLGMSYRPDRQERAMVDLINAYRGSHGLQPLSLQGQLGRAAKHHSLDMAKKNYFSHRLWSGLTPEQNIERFGFTGWRAVGENIAAGYKKAAAVLTGWQGSPDHDQNLRDPNFTEIGVGRAYSADSRHGWYWTATFGSR